MLSLTSFDPIRQAGLVFAAAIIAMLLGWAVDAAGWIDVERLFAWSVATAFTLFFAILNSLMSITAKSAMRYWGKSIYSYLALAVANGLAARLFSGVPLNDAESYRWIYIVVTIGFLVFLSMINFMKRIVNFAEREEWNEPRPKNRKR
jgi:hypothetical protein